MTISSEQKSGDGSGEGAASPPQFNINALQPFLLQLWNLIENIYVLVTA